MTKFFLPPVKDEKGHFFKNKKKIMKTSCNESLYKIIFSLLQKLLTRQIQKVIRKIKQQPLHKENLEKSFQLLKSIKKSDLKHLGYYILKSQMNVEEENLQITLKIQKNQAKIDEKQFSQALKQFYKAIKNKEIYKKSISQMQKKRTEVKDKKKTKKQKMKMKKKTKIISKRLQNKEESANLDDQQIKDEGQIINQQNISQDISYSLHKDEPIKIQRENGNKKKITQQKKIKTQFKKTGRNKFLFQKKNKTFNKNLQRNQKTNSISAKFQKSKIPGRHETPHPSWQAKRQIKNQMFIQPFQGKRILL